MNYLVFLFDPMGINNDGIDIHTTIEDLSTKFHELDASYFSEHIESFNF